MLQQLTATSFNDFLFNEQIGWGTSFLYEIECIG
jgi:hypothetical protein